MTMLLSEYRILQFVSRKSFSKVFFRISDFCLIFYSLTCNAALTLCRKWREALIRLWVKNDFFRKILRCLEIGRNSPQALLLD